MQTTNTYAFSEIMTVLGAQSKRMAYVALHQLGYTYVQIGSVAGVLEWTARDAITSQARSNKPAVNIIQLGAKKITQLGYLMGGNIAAYNQETEKIVADSGSLVCSDCGKHVDQVFPSGLCWNCHRSIGSLVQVRLVSKSAKSVKVPARFISQNGKAPTRTFYEV